MTPVPELSQISPPDPGNGPVYVVDNSAQTSLVSLVYALGKGATLSITEDGFETSGRTFAAGSLIVGGVAGDKLKPLLNQFALSAVSLASTPNVRTHPASAPRIAF